MQIGSFSSAICLLLKDVLLLPMFARCCLYRMETGRLSCRNLTGSGEDHPENSTAASIYRAGIQMRFLYLYDRCMHLYPCFIVHLQYTYRLFTFADIYHTTGKRNLQVKSLTAIYDAGMGGSGRCAQNFVWDCAKRIRFLVLHRGNDSLHICRESF